MSHWLRGLFIGVTLAFAGCGQRHLSQVAVQERLLPHPNPTAYDFDATVSDVKASIQTAYDDWHFETSKRYGEKVWHGDGDAVSKRVHSRALQLIGHELLRWRQEGDGLANGPLAKPGKENDAYLAGEGAPFCESEVYFKDSQPLLYYADFHIHLTAISPRKTRVEIYTYGSKVAADVDQRFSPVHGPGLKLVDVAPTTVEEYQILRRIGDKLGVKEMPPLVTPPPNAPLRQITKPVE